MASTLGPVVPRHPTSFDKVAPKAAPSVAASRPPSTTVASATKASAVADPFYGHEPTARLCAKFVTHLFACPDYPPQSSAASSPAPGHNVHLAHFIAYALHRTRLHQSVTFAALYLLQRLKQRFPAARGSSGHRLFLSAFMIASKVICDDTYSNKSWCIVGQGMFALREVNQMEREMCSYLDWELNVDPDCLRQFEAAVRDNFRGPGPYKSIPLPLPAAKAAAAAAQQPYAAPPEPATITVATPPSSSPPSARAPVASSRPASRERYASPASDCSSPGTPGSSHSMSASPATTPSPRTPPESIEEAHAKVVAQASPVYGERHGPSASLKAAAMVRALQQEPGAPAHFGIATAADPPTKPSAAAAAGSAPSRQATGKTFLLPKSRSSEPFAFAQPASW